MLRKDLAEHCSSLYYHYRIQVLPLFDTNASLIADKANWARSRRFDLGNEHFHQGDKLLFLDQDVYITGMDVDAMFDLISDTDNRNGIIHGWHRHQATRLPAH